LAAAIAVAAPLQPRERAIVADELGVEPDRLIIAIAPELRIRYALERIYNIARPQRFLRAPGSARSEPKQIALGVEQLKLEDSGPITARKGNDERRRYLEPMSAAPRTKTGPITPRSGTLIDAGRILDMLRTSDRERVAQLAMDAVSQLVPNAEAAVLLTPRSDVAVSWTSFRRDGRVLPPLAVPLDGSIAAALRTKQPQRTNAGALGPVDQLLFVTLGLTRGELVVAPLVARDRIIAVLVVAGAGLDAAVLAAIAAAAAEGFARLMREAIK
ncbi:MAG TPA: GAF domain-containing protein, partial [Kofleriaceae bacterium]|nr:GAF domain-containing protein [Kofleriaceae bacterium]